MLTKDINIRVRYAETDQMGYVYYGNYATYYEVARVEMLRKLGFRYKDLEQEGIMMPVLELKTKYIRPAKYDDLLTVRISVKELPTARITFFYEVLNESGELLNIGETTLVFVDMKTGKTVRFPEKIAAVMQPYFETA